MLSVEVKLFGRVLIKRVRARTECAIGEEQCGLRQGRGCMDQVFAVRQLCEKHLAIGNDVFWAFMDLEKAYNTIDQHGVGLFTVYFIFLQKYLYNKYSLIYIYIYMC